MTAKAEDYGLDLHGTMILEDYRANLPVYRKMEEIVYRQLTELLAQNQLVVNGIEGRVKRESSLAGKLALKGQKYADVSDITDIVGLRIITFYQEDVDKIAALVDELYEVVEVVDKRRELGKDSFGYLSLHFVCLIPPSLYCDPEHPEINRFRFELQMRSALQHVWAAMNHDIGYKSSVEVPPEHLRSLTRLAGILELADEEFSRIRKELSDYRRKAEQLVKDGSFDEVSLDGDTWRSYIALDPFASLNNKIAAINQAEVQPLSGMPYLEPLLKLGMKTLGDVENMRKRYADKAYRLALHQITGTDLDIIASTLGLQNLCIVYAAERDGEKGIEFFLDCLNGPSKYNAESARRICAQLKKLHDR